jgi:hypothetical protein
MKSCRCHGKKRKGDGMSKRESKNIQWESEKSRKSRKMRRRKSAALSCP